MKLDETPIYYVYGHYKPNSDVPFYIGKGKKYRAYDRGSRSDYWKKIVRKYGLRVEIMYGNLPEAHAFDLEMEFIRRYGRADKGCGPLINMTDGGEGPALEESAKAHLRIINSGEGNPFFGKTHSSEFVESMIGNTHGIGNKSRTGQRETDHTKTLKSHSMPTPYTWRFTDEFGEETIFFRLRDAIKIFGGTYAMLYGRWKANKKFLKYTINRIEK